MFRKWAKKFAGRVTLLISTGRCRWWNLKNWLSEYIHVTFWKVPRTIHSSKLCNGSKLVSVGLCLCLFFQLSLLSLCLLLLFLTPGFWPQSPAAENWWVACYLLHSPYGRHVRLQARLDNVLWTCRSSFVLYTGKLDTQGNLSFCSVKRNVILHVLKLINQRFFIFHFTIVFVIYLYPCTEIDVKSFKCVSWLKFFL